MLSIAGFLGFQGFQFCDNTFNKDCGSHGNHKGLETTYYGFKKYAMKIVSFFAMPP